jgi:hypothetical protein
MPILNVEKTIRSLRKTPVMLKALLRDVTPEQARQASDGPDGWSVLFIVCHLRDFEDIFYQRITMALEQDCPFLPSVNQEALPAANNYAYQDFHQALKAYSDRRRTLISLVERLNETQLMLRAVHQEYGEGTVLDLAINVVLHDVNHIEQIVRALGDG